MTLTVTGVTQVKIMTEEELPRGPDLWTVPSKNVQDIKNIILQTLMVHLRFILGTLAVKQIYQDWDQLDKLVREVAAPDVGRMGIRILNRTIKDIYDKEDCLSSQTAVVQRDADIGAAEAEQVNGCLRSWVQRSRC